VAISVFQWVMKIASVVSLPRNDIMKQSPKGVGGISCNIFKSPYIPLF
jgi:hypothetical protein